MGASKHAAELSEYFNGSGEYLLTGYIINLEDVVNHPNLTKPIVSLPSFLEKHPAASNIALIGAIGNYERKSIIELLENKGYQFINIIHHHNYISPSIKISKRNCIAPGYVINANVRIGNHCIVNSNCNISHDCIIGDYTTISPGVTHCR